MKKNKEFLKQVLVIDGNHLCHRAYHKFANLRTIDGDKTSIIYGGLFILHSLIEKFGPDKVITVFDSDRSKFRLDILPDYKKREPKLGFDPVDFHGQKDIMICMLKYLDVPVVMKTGFEADDLITQVATKYSQKGWEVVIVTGDKDFNQLVKPGIIIWNVNKNFQITHYNMLSKIGYRPDQCVDYLTLLGDSSDNIPGYPGMGEKRTSDFLKQFDSIENFLITKDAKFGKLDRNQLKELKYRNKRLIDLKLFYRKFLKDKPIPYRFGENNGMDLSSFEKFTKKFELSSFNKPNFINTFKELL